MEVYDDQAFSSVSSYRIIYRRRTSSVYCVQLVVLWDSFEAEIKTCHPLFFFVQDVTCLPVIDMAANGANCEQPQRRTGTKDKLNGKSAGELENFEVLVKNMNPPLLCNSSFNA